jgi:hypothetical protein
VARKPFHAKCKIKKTKKIKGFSLNLATFGTSPTVGSLLRGWFFPPPQGGRRDEWAGANQGSMAFKTP